MPVPARDPKDRFLEKVEKKANGCWMWTAAKKPAGYGNFMMKKGHFESSHRASWLLHKGEIADGLWVLHRCDTPGCVNPEHLFLGTAQDNHNDMHAKGRARGVPAGGELSPAAKLKDAEVVSMRRERARGELLKSLAQKYGISEGHVSLVCRRLSRKKAEAAVGAGA